MARDLNDLLSADESVVLETRQHWFVVLRAIGVLVLGMLLVAGLVWYVREANWLDNDAGRWIEYALWAVLATLAAVALWRMLVWVTERFYVTTSKIVYAHGVLNRNVTTTPLARIDEMTLHRPLLGRMLGFGRLDVENSAGGTEPLAGLEYLPRPRKLFQVISERSRNQRMLEGGAHRDDDADGLVDPRSSPQEPPRGAEPAGSAQAEALREGLGSWKPSGDATSHDD